MQQINPGCLTPVSVRCDKLGAINHVAGVLLLIGLVAGCGSGRAPRSEGADSPWGASAVEFFASHGAALCSQDLFDIAKFYAATATVDYRAVQIGPFPGQLREGRPAILAFIDLCLSPERQLSIERNGTFLGADGAVVLERWTSGTPDNTWSVAVMAVVGAEGIVSLRYAPSVDSVPAEDRDEVKAIADGIVAAHLDPDASVLETYVFAPSGTNVKEVIAVTEERKDGCRVERALRWTFDTASAVDESVYLDIASARVCLDPDALPSGWWDGLTIPDALDQRQTGSLGVGNNTIRLFNSNADRERLAEWALERFETAGLRSPTVDKVVFEPSRSCADLAGLAHLSTGNAVVYMCVANICDDLACNGFTDAAELSMLHELAHHWLDQQPDYRSMRKAFMDLTGTKIWNEATLVWEERGAEWAAETIAWGLMDHRVELLRLGFPPGETLEAAYQLLTAHEPATTCPGP